MSSAWRSSVIFVSAQLMTLPNIVSLLGLEQSNLQKLKVQFAAKLVDIRKLKTKNVCVAFVCGATAMHSLYDSPSYLLFVGGLDGRDCNKS